MPCAENRGRCGLCCQPLSGLVYALLVLSQVFTHGWTQESCSEEGAVRLVGGRNSDEGRLEICATQGSGPSLWGTVCNDAPTGRESDGFDINAVKVVCRQLGVQESALSDVVTNIFFGGGASHQPIHLDNVGCEGTEASLLNCTHNGVGNGRCTHREDIGIRCKQAQDCTNGDVRLVDSAENTNAVVGRVEYCVGGAWGTVCHGNEWSKPDAIVVCKQLGLNALDPNILVGSVPQVSDSRTPIVLNGLECLSTEDRLDDCYRSNHVQHCLHSNDVGANCSNIKECNESDVRLIQTDTDQTENEGRAEYCSMGLWSPICYDNWDNNDARVFCRQIGYHVEGGYPLGIESPGDRSSVLPGLNCTGTESNISQCRQGNGNTCYGGNAGVICPVLNASICTDGDVRLQGGSLSNEIGHVEVCISGQWGLVCDDDWDDIDASVVCRQLGYSGGVATSKSLFGTNEKGVYFLDDVNCSGNESNILECPHPPSTNCIHRREEAGVICRVTNTGSSERCSAEHTNKTISISDSSVSNLTAGSIGTCQRYLRQSNLCNGSYKSTDYIFTAMNQTVLSMELDDRVLPILSGDNVECHELISKVVCHYFFAPCGENGLLHLPQSVCAEECHYVESTCAEKWSVVNDILSRAEGLSTVVCNATGSLLGGLSPCCVDDSIQTKIPTTTNDMRVTSTTDAVSSSSVGLIASVPVLFILIALLGVTILVACIYLTIRKKKAYARRHQLRYYDQRRKRTVMMMTSFKKDHEDNEFGENNSIIIRSDGSKKLPHAVPNPYGNYKPEFGQNSPLLKPDGSPMMKRLSSSIIRELSSNMLIPYTRLKLMECIGQGEFGVVYKGQHTEPEGDIGYKTTIVAVKTLKGFFDDSQVNKIMEESIKMKHFDHPNVLHLIGVCLDAGPAPYIVMPFMANGSLLHYLKKERNNIVLQVGGDEDVKIDVRKRLTVMCLQIASGMEYLAGEKFVHRDLAARNCMIDIHFVIKIADFGLSEDIYSKNYFRQSSSDRSVKLPVKWMAPESLSDGVFSEKSDVWSFGVTCWEVFSGGKTPYPGMDPLLLSQMLDTEQRLNKPLNAACYDEMYNLMMDCWAKQPDKRPSFSEIITAISKYTEVIAGYLDVNFNPFQPAHMAVGNAATAEDVIDDVLPSSDNDKNIMANSQLDSTNMVTLQNSIPKGSLRPPPKIAITEQEEEKLEA